MNRDRYRSFELYRRSIDDVEIITFDELLARARFIAQHDETADPRGQKEATGLEITPQAAGPPAAPPPHDDDPSPGERSTNVPPPPPPSDDDVPF